MTIPYFDCLYLHMILLPLIVEAALSVCVFYLVQDHCQPHSIQF